MIFFMADDFEYKFKEKSHKMLLSEISLPVEYRGTLDHSLLLLRHASMSAWSNDWISSPDDAELNSTLSSTVLLFCPRAMQQISDCNVSDIQWSPMFLDATPHGNHMPENLLGEAAWEPKIWTCCAVTHWCWTKHMVLASPHYQHTCKTQKGMKIRGRCVSHAGITSIEQLP